MDLVDEQDRTRIGFELLDDLFEPFFEVAAIACAGKERADVECEHRCIAQHVRHFTMDDAARETLGDRGLADTSLADESGLFFSRRHNTWIVRLISASRPISGSILPSRAFLLRLT